MFGGFTEDDCCCKCHKEQKIDWGDPKYTLIGFLSSVAIMTIGLIYTIETEQGRWMLLGFLIGMPNMLVWFILAERKSKQKKLTSFTKEKPNTERVEP